MTALSVCTFQCVHFRKQLCGRLMAVSEHMQPAALSTCAPSYLTTCVWLAGKAGRLQLLVVLDLSHGQEVRTNVELFVQSAHVCMLFVGVFYVL